MIQEKDMQAPREEMEQMFARQYSQCNKLKELKEHKDYTDIMSEWLMGRKFYVASDVDAVLAEKDKEIAELKKKLMPCLNGDCILTCEVVEKYGKENAELKQKLEDAKATAYAESVDAGMRERRLKRALWIHRAIVAKLNKEGCKEIRAYNPFIGIQEYQWEQVEAKCRAMAEKFK